MSESLYDQLLGLQTVPHAYENWEEYRDALTRHVIECTDAGSSLLVVGAGAMCDLDLHLLLRHFRQITLLDRSEKAMAEAIVREEVNGGSTADVRLCVRELLGISEESQRSFGENMTEVLRQELMLGSPDPQRLGTYFAESLKTLFDGRRIMEDPSGELYADHVICSGVHSQLLMLFPQMAEVLHRYMAFDLNGIYTLVRELNAVAASELNTRLLASAGKSVFFGLETGRSGFQGGIEGAAQALLDLRNRGVDVRNGMELMWPLDASHGKIYRVRVLEVPADGN